MIRPYITDTRCEHCGAIRGGEAHPLTPKQCAIYRYIAARIRLSGTAPSLEEIATHFRYASLSTVHEHLTALERKGWIKREFNLTRSIRCLVRDA